ncbi:MAG: LuxR C-terminal-related transcriptional regulator [Cellulosilyticaceae bacterium]
MMNLLMVDTHEVVRRGLILTLKEEVSDINFIEASHLCEAIEKLNEVRMDYVFLDVNLSGENGLELVELGSKIHKDTKFVVFTDSKRKGDFNKAKELGVVGYILKETSLKEIVKNVKAIRDGAEVFSPQLTAQHAVDPRVEIRQRLTEREFEILREIGKGLTNGQIADTLFITENTVKKHTTSILGKLEFTNRTEVALLATNLWRRKDD